MRSLFLLYLLLMLCMGNVLAQKQRIKASSYPVKDSVTLRHITFDGNKKTRTRVLLREFNVDEGNKIASRDIDDYADLNRKRLMNLSLFSDVTIVTDVINDSTIDWQVKVKEQWYIIPELTLKLADRNINVWWNEQNHDLRRTNLGVTLKHRNFRGNMEQLGVTAQVGYTQKYGVEYFRPYVDKKQRHGIGASFFVSKNEETFYTTDLNKLRFVKKPGTYIIHQFEAAVLYVHRPGYATRHSLEARYKNYRANDTIVQLNPSYYDTAKNRVQLLEFTYRYDLNQVDNWNYPLNGLKVVGYTIVRAGIQGMDFQSQLLAEVGYFKRMGRKWLLAEVFRGRLTAPEEQPYVFRSALGSNSEYVRGYEYFVIDGSQYALLRSNLKYELVNTAIRNFPIKYLAVIPIRIYPKVFLDVGYVANKFPGNSFLNNRGLIGYGVGVDVVSAYDFKFRLEYAWNHLGEKGLFLHINSE